MFFVFFFFFFNKLSRECCPSNEPRHLSSCKHATEISSVQRGARQGKIAVGEVCPATSIGPLYLFTRSVEMYFTILAFVDLSLVNDHFRCWHCAQNRFCLGL